MTPDQKRAAGKGVVGYLRVSSAGQTDGWSLASQEQAIREWAARYAIPIIAIEVAPDGCESGATAFDERTGWQAVERHIATGMVGWIAVASVDRLSRDLGALAERVRQWHDQDIAIVAPAQGYGLPEGVGPFMLHIWGAMADHERKRLLGRILPGMQSRLQAGLPLGTQPYGYRVHVDAPVAGQRPRRHLMPDPVTAPVVAAIYQQALAQPEWGDRRMAGWAAQQWPAESWSPGRIAGLLSNPIYAGVLRSAVRDQSVLLLENHPAIVSASEHGRVQAIREQRKRDQASGINAVSAMSWLGGIVRCGRCGGQVTWRSFPVQAGASHPPSGQYSCTGLASAPGTTSSGHGCGTVWSQYIEAFVWRAVERLLEGEAGLLRRMVSQAIDQLPGFLDDRRQRAAAEEATIEAEVERLTEDLADGHLDSVAYATAIERCAARRSAARELLRETDGWTYLSRLITLQDGPHAGRLRWITVQESWGRLARSEQRRLLRALSSTITLQDPRKIGALDGPGEQPELGIFTGVTIVRPSMDGAASVIALGMARLLVTNPGHDLAGGLERCGWSTRDDVDGVRSWEFGREVSDDGTPTATIVLARTDAVTPQALTNKPLSPAQEPGHER